MRKAEDDGAFINDLSNGFIRRNRASLDHLRMLENAEKIDAETDGVDGVAEGQFTPFIVCLFRKRDGEIGTDVLVCVDVKKSYDFRNRI